jgi:hypothetical protein
MKGTVAPPSSNSTAARDLLAGMGNAAWSDARHDRELGLHMRELQAQRNLADKAEASRFTELRHYMDLQVTEARQREAVNYEALQATLIKGQRDMQAQVDMLARQLDPPFAAPIPRSQ